MTITQRTQGYLDLLQPHAKAIFTQLLNECHKRGINAQISESLRTDARQQQLYAEKKSKAKEGRQSMHYYGIACDIFVPKGNVTDYSHNHKIWELCLQLNLDQQGMRWGGNFTSIFDAPHFELSYGYGWQSFWKKYGDSAQHKSNTSIAKTTNNTTQQTFSKPMNSILSTLADKGIDIAVSLIPGGSLVQSAVKSIAKNLLGNENASEEELQSAIANATPEQLENLRLEIARMETQVKIEQEDTLQAIEKTNQMQIEKDAKFMDLAINLVNAGKGKYLVAGVLLYYGLLALTIGAYRFWFDFDVITQHTVIGMLTVMAFIPFAPFIGNGVMNKILNSLCDIFLNIAEIGKGISATPKVVFNKILKK